MKQVKIKKKHDTFIDTAIELHRVSHKHSPFITCEALQEGNFVKIKFDTLKNTHEFYRALINFLCQ